TLPAPVVDPEAQRGKRFGDGIRGDVRLLAVPGYWRGVRLAPGTVLPAHRIAQNVFGTHDTHRLEHLRLLVAHRVRAQRRWRLHAQIREHLEHMILDHVPQHARALVVAAPAFDADRFRHRELDVIDVVPAPERLEQPVGETKGQQVLYRFLAQIMIDAEDLF